MVDMTPEHSGVMPERPTRRSEPPRPSETLAERLSRGASIPLARDFAPTGTVEDHDAPGRHSISPELALVDPELSALARRELPDAPWLAFGGHGSSTPAVTPASAPPTVVARDEPVSAPRPVPLERLPAPDEDDAGVTPSIRPLQLVPPPEQARPAPVVVAPPAAAPAKVVSPHEHVPPPRVSAPAASRTRRRRRYVTQGRDRRSRRLGRRRGHGLVPVARRAEPDRPPDRSAGRERGPHRRLDASDVVEREDVGGTGGATEDDEAKASQPAADQAADRRQRVHDRERRTAARGRPWTRDRPVRALDPVRHDSGRRCADRSRGGFRAKAEPLSGVTGDVQGRFVSARAATGRVALSGARCSARTLQFRASRS